MFSVKRRDARCHTLILCLCFTTGLKVASFQAETCAYDVQQRDLFHNKVVSASSYRHKSPVVTNSVSQNAVISLLIILLIYVATLIAHSRPVFKRRS
jgi:hypothetical protein